MFNINFVQPLWLFWNICWHSLWVFGGAIAATSFFHYFFQFPDFKTEGFLADFQEGFGKKTFPLLVIILFLFRFFDPTFSSLFILATLLLRTLLWIYQLLRNSLQGTKKQLTPSFLPHKPTLKSKPNHKLLSSQNWKRLASKIIELFKEASPSYFGGLFLVFLIGFLPASFLVRFTSYSPNFIVNFFQNTTFGLILGFIFPFSYLAKLPLAIYLADLGFPLVGIFSFFSASLILVWVRSFFEKYSLKQTLAFSGYLIFGFIVIALIVQSLYVYVPWQKPLRITVINREIAFNLDFYLNCLGVFGAILILVLERKGEKLDFSNQINKIMAKIKKPRR